MLKVSYFFDCTFLSFDTDASADPTSVVHFNLLPLRGMYIHQLVEDCNVDLKSLKRGFFKIALQKANKMCDDVSKYNIF